MYNGGRYDTVEEVIRLSRSATVNVSNSPEKSARTTKTLPTKVGTKLLTVPNKERQRRGKSFVISKKKIVAQENRAVPNVANNI